jgi:hypothetical protein
MEVVRFAVGTVVRCVAWLVFVLGLLPVSYVLASVVTAALTGWSYPEGFIQGCETNIECAESGTFWPVWFLFISAYVIGGVFVAFGLSKRSRRRRSAVPAAEHVPA